MATRTPSGREVRVIDRTVTMALGSGFSSAAGFTSDPGFTSNAGFTTDAGFTSAVGFISANGAGAGRDATAAVRGAAAGDVATGVSASKRVMAAATPGIKELDE